MTVAEDFFAPLDALGAARPKGMSAAAWREGRARLVEALRYLEPDELARLRADVEVGLRARRAWLPPVQILALAALIRPDPAAGRERAASIARFMCSAPGRAALAEGHAVEMHASAEAVGHGFHVSDFQVSRWREAAEARRRAMAFDRERAALGDQAAATRVAAAEALEQEVAGMVRGGGDA